MDLVEVMVNAGGYVTTGIGSGTVLTGIMGIVITGPGDGSVATGHGSAINQIKDKEITNNYVYNKKK